jgi:ATP-binding cassette subfamily B protein
MEPRATTDGIESRSRIDGTAVVTNGATSPATAASAHDRSFAALGSLVVNNLGPNVLSTLLRVASTMLMALHPYFLAELVTSIDDKDRALRFLLLLLGSGAGHMVLWTICDFLVSKQVVPLSYEFKRMAFNAVWDKDYRSFVDHPSGKTAAYVNEMRSQVEDLWDAVHYSFLPMAASIPIYVFLLIRTAPSNALGYVVFLVVAAVIMTRVAKPVNARQHHLTDTTSSNNGRVFDSYANFVNVFSFRAHRKEIVRNNGEIDGLIGDSIRFNYALTSYWAIASFLVRIGLWSSVMGYSWYLFDTGRITFTAFVVSITVLLDFTTQYWEVVYHFGKWVDTSAGYREAYNYLFPGQNIVDEYYRDEGRDRTGRDGSPVTVSLADALEVRNLSFAYPDAPDELVLDNVSFRVRRGEKVGIVGRSGEGKSTLIKILLGFYAPTHGVIAIDGRPVDAELLSRVQSYVPQDTSLFQETIGYNIAYAIGGPEIGGGNGSSDSPAGAPTEAEVADAAAKAHIDEFVKGLPMGYDTLVGERGIKLSLGQRQRIAIARAFLKPADLLILDEATSALDSETEGYVQDALEHLWQDKAAIIIAHRLATLNNVDRILVMEGGRVVQEGTKDELLAAGGPFADLWARQRAGML